MERKKKALTPIFMPIIMTRPTAMTMGTMTRLITCTLMNIMMNRDTIMGTDTNTNMDMDITTAASRISGTSLWGISRSPRR